MTRHNIGFTVIDGICHHLFHDSSSSSSAPSHFRGNLHSGSHSNFKKEHQAETKPLRIHSEPTLLAKPQTLMNLSGKSVGALIRYYQVQLSKLLVIHDEIDLPFGTMKYQKNRGHGGHNGIRHIHQCLGTNEYHRLKVGVGRPSNDKLDVTDFVLQNFSKEELKELPIFLNSIIESVLHFIEKGFASAANQYNQRSQ